MAVFWLIGDVTTSIICSVLRDGSSNQQTVFAQTWTIPPVFESHIASGSDAETHYTALIRCEDGIVLSVERGEFMTMHTHEGWEIIGTEGSLKLTMGDGKPESVVPTIARNNRRWC